MSPEEIQGQVAEKRTGSSSNGGVGQFHARLLGDCALRVEPVHQGTSSPSWKPGPLCREVWPRNTTLQVRSDSPDFLRSPQILKQHAHHHLHVLPFRMVTSCWGKFKRWLNILNEKMWDLELPPNTPTSHTYATALPSGETRGFQKE